jgi:hypothetical protein
MSTQSIDLRSVLSASSSAQRNLNGSVHDWYQTVLGFSDHLVAGLIGRFDLRPGQKVLDPFCGSGTTLVECMKAGLDCAGIEANPVGVFATRVKTHWLLKPQRLLACAERAKDSYKQKLKTSDYQVDPTYRYLDATGMLKRGWISSRPLKRAITLKQAINEIRTAKPYRDALMLALIAEVVGASSNVKFGPELYCGPAKIDSPVLQGFQDRVDQMASDLELLADLKKPQAMLCEGDSRFCHRTLGRTRRYHAVICSPPYPTEHDYTRNTRLELAFLERVTDVESLRTIKKTMIRSHTKGIYKDDNDASLLSVDPILDEIVNGLRVKIQSKSHGFARLYPRVVQEYFGGMKRHLRSVRSVLAPGAKCAYVVGDQSSYLQVYIPTATILATIAETVGFRVIGIEHLRGRWSTATSKVVNENILFLEWRGNL